MDADGCNAEPSVSACHDFAPMLSFACGTPVAPWTAFLPHFGLAPDKAFLPFPQFAPEALQKLAEFDWTRFFGQAPLQFSPHITAVPELAGERFIGTLTLQQRRERVLRFLDKRKRRSFAKKISYHCRKKVADRRIRVKGRFVTSEQAAALQVESCLPHAVHS